MTIGKRIKSARSRNGMTQKELAEKIKVSPQVISNWERGYTTPSADDIANLAHALDVSADQLLIGSQKPIVFPDWSKGSNIPESTRVRSEEIILKALAKKRAEDAQKGVELVMIPVLGTIKAGYDLYADQQVIDYKPTAAADVADGEYFYLVVKGDSMIDDGIKEGMRVLVRRQDTVEQGKIGVVLVNGDEATLKRVFYQDGVVVLQAANANVPPRVLPIEDAKIQGQVTQVVWDV